jgi:hypothetical protein
MNARGQVKDYANFVLVQKIGFKQIFLSYKNHLKIAYYRNLAKKFP